jgi:16S rRNA (cytosine967-C5)-methyltransferase
MEIPSLLGHISELFRIIQKSAQPPDKLTGEYLKSKKYLGSNDRKFISENLFNILRIKSLPEHVYDSYISINQVSTFDIKQFAELFICSIGLLYSEKSGINNQSLLKKIESSGDLVTEISKTIVLKANIPLELSLDIIREMNEKLNEIYISKQKAPISVIFGQQEWIYKYLKESPGMTNKEIEDLYISLLHPSPLTLRINTKPESRSNIIQILREFDSNCDITKYSPFGIRLSRRIDLNTIRIYKSGAVDVQDEGSQLISLALNPNPGETILDACAGAGGKSLHMAVLTNNQAKIIATDIELRKLKELNNRSKKAGFTSIQTLDNKTLLNSRYKFDKILIDAPCSGMGTVRRSPMLKWKLTPESLKKYSDKQKMILSQYSGFLKPGGVLVYSTCSFLRAENTDVISDFLNENDNFYPDSLYPIFEKQGVELPDLKQDDFEYQTLPSVHGCDGFYFARLRKTDD